MLDMRKFLIAACCLLPLFGAEDPKELVRRALSAYTADDAAQRQYTYLQREDIRILGGGGDLKRHELRTYDVTLLEGSPYKRLVKRDDRPLSPEEDRQQQEALGRSIQQRRAESPEERRQRIAEFERKRQERRGDLNEVANAFDFTLVGDDTIDGVPAWVVEGTPRAGYKARSKSAAYFGKLKGRIWISKADNHVMKMDAVTLDTIAIGAFLIRFGQGGHIAIEFAHVNNDAWLPKHVLLTGSARVLLLKGYHLDADYSFSDYKKFTVESRVVDTGTTR